MGFFSDNKKYVSKEDGIKLKVDKYPQGARYVMVIEDESSPDRHDTYIAYRTADGSYTEGYHGSNLTSDEKRQFGDDFDDFKDNGYHNIGK